MSGVSLQYIAFRVDTACSVLGYMMGVNDWAIVLYFDPWGAHREVEQRFCVKQKEDI